MMSFLGTSLASVLVKIPFRDPTTDVPQTAVLPVADRLPRLFGTTIHSGILIAIAAVLLVHLVMTRTAFGLKSLDEVGVDLNTVRELLGRSDYKMTLRYAHLAPAHKAAAVAKLIRSLA